MSTEIVALIGVAAGALLNGGVQTLQRERERRVLARVAARLFSGDLARAQDDVGKMLDVGRWPDLGTKYSREVEVWVAQRAAFAAAVSISDYTRVAVAYQILVDLPGVSEPGCALTADDRNILSTARRVIDDGYEVAIDRTAPRYEKRSARKAMLRRKERLAAPKG